MTLIAVPVAGSVLEIGFPASSVYAVAVSSSKSVLFLSVFPSKSVTTGTTLLNFFAFFSRTSAAVIFKLERSCATIVNGIFLSVPLKLPLPLIVTLAVLSPTFLLFL